MKLKEPMFIGIEFQNTKNSDKKRPTISVRLNLASDDVIYVASSRSRMEVVAFEEDDTSLFVTDVEGVDGPNVYNLFRNEAVKYAKKELKSYIKGLEGLSKEEYDNKNLKSLNDLTNQLYHCLTDRQDFYTDLQKQVSLITSRKLPRVNEYLVFEDDGKINYPVTARVPYKNPLNQEVTKEEIDVVDEFLDVFLDEYNKKTLAWYIGGALSNVDIHDDRISKLMILSSSRGGSGKSTLIGAISDALFTPHYRDIKDDFDSFFYSNSKFGVSALSTKRLSVYSEAAFMNTSYVRKDDDEVKHDFSGMNVSTIKSLITEGYVSSEAKYGDRQMERLNGFHIVLTNHPPIINEDNEAMNRRILPIMINPSRMSEKANILNLWGKKRFDDYVKKHRQAFANYFVSVFKDDEYAFTDTDYDHKDYVTDISDAQNDLDTKTRKAIIKQKEIAEKGIIKLLNKFAQDNNVSVDLLVNDIKEVVSKQDEKGTTPITVSKDIRLEEGTLYINSSKNFLVRYGNYASKLRNELDKVYGPTIRRFQYRMFQVPIEK